MSKILIYDSGPPIDRLDRLKQAVARMIPEQNMVICHNLTSLFNRVMAFTHYYDVAILRASDRAEMDAFGRVRSYLMHMDVILIVPDDERSTMSKGSQLFPRFILSCHGNFEAVAPLVEKMIQRSENRKR